MHGNGCQIENITLGYATREGIAIRPQYPEEITEDVWNDMKGAERKTLIAKMSAKIIMGGSIKGVRGYYCQRETVSVSGMTRSDTNRGPRFFGNVIDFVIDDVFVVANYGYARLGVEKRERTDADCNSLGIDNDNLASDGLIVASQRSAVELSDGCAYAVDNSKAFATVSNVVAFGFADGGFSGASLEGQLHRDKDGTAPALGERKKMRLPTPKNIRLNGDDSGALIGIPITGNEIDDD